MQIARLLGPIVLVAMVLDEPVGRPDASGRRARLDLVYCDDGHERHRLDLYLPAPGPKPAPLVLWIHGGGWKGGSKERCPARFLVDEGFAVASIGYRLSSHAIFPAQIHDCKSAVRWLRAHSAEFGIDSKRFGVWGASAGGHLAALLGTSGDVPGLEGDLGHVDTSSRVQAVVDWFGPTDFLQMDEHAPAGSRLVHNAPDSPESKLIGGPIQENADKVRRANPVTYVSADDPPYLIVHGDQDPLVPIHQSQLLAEALEASGVRVRFERLEGAGHGGPAFQSAAMREQIVRFFRDELARTPGG